MTSGYGSGGSVDSVQAEINKLETSPSKNQPTSKVYGTRRTNGGADSASGSVPGFKDKKGGRSEKGAS